MPDAQSNLDKKLPQPIVTRKKRRNLAWIWLVPIVAVLIGLSIVWSAYNKRGPTITISFGAATGLEVGKTQVRYRDVVIGLVKDIKLSDQREGVIVTVELQKEAQGFAHETAKFWVVKPRIGAGGVSGLSTLLSGAYIAVDSAEPSNEKLTKKSFVGLENPPPIFNDQPGTSFAIKTNNLGSLESGSPVYYKRVQVGLVTDYALNKAGDAVIINVFVNAPYDKFVTKRTRFWNASGINVSFGAQGVEVNTESIASIVAGGLAFENFGLVEGEPADKAVPFKLFDSIKDARSEPEGLTMPIVMRFAQSTKGLVKGAPIDFRGVDLGVIDDVQIDFDEKTATFATVVTGSLYFHRLGKEYERIVEQKRTVDEVTKTMSDLVAAGMRAQLRVGNILTGQLYVTLAMFPEVKRVSVKPSLPFAMPTRPSDSIEELQSQLGSIVAKLDKVPYEEIGNNLNTALKTVNHLTAGIDKSVAPELVRALKNANVVLEHADSLIAPGSELSQNISVMLEELTRGLHSIRSLTDTLQMQPDAILRGRNTKNYSRETLGAQNR